MSNSHARMMDCYPCLFLWHIFMYHANLLQSHCAVIFLVCNINDHHPIISEKFHTWNSGCCYATSFDCTSGIKRRNQFAVSKAPNKCAHLRSAVSNEFSSRANAHASTLLYALHLNRVVMRHHMECGLRVNYWSISKCD